MRSLRIVLVVAVLMVLSGPSRAEPDGKRAAPPSPEAQKKAEKEIREVYAAEFGDRRPEGKAALSAKLLTQAEEGKEAPASRYMMLRLAAGLAAASGDLSTMERAFDRLDSLFDADTEAARAEALTTASALSATDVQQGVAEGFSNLSDRAIEREDFVAAKKHLARALNAARLSKDQGLATLVQQRTTAVNTMQVDAAKVADARKTLEKTPDDKAACAVVGQFEAFLKGDWDAGLPKLAKADIKGVSELAAKEAGNKEALFGDPQKVARLADEWWEVAESLSPANQATVRQHAAELYQGCVDRLEGIARKRAEQRMNTAFGTVEKKFQASQLPQILTATPWRFMWPHGSRTMRFAANGQLSEGANRAEGRWRLVGSKLELLNDRGLPNKRMTYDPDGNYWRQADGEKDVVMPDLTMLLPVSTNTPRRLTPRDREVVKQLQQGEWELGWGSGFIRLSFGTQGQFTKGRNDNESWYRVVNGKIEMINRNGVVYGRYEYDPKGKVWIHEAGKQVNTTMGMYSAQRTQILKPVGRK